jgi:hypothetical protein
MLVFIPIIIVVETYLPFDCSTKLASNNFVVQAFLVGIIIVKAYSLVDSSTKPAPNNFIVHVYQGLFNLIKPISSLEIKLLSSNMIWTFCLFNWPSSFKLKAKHLM